MNKTIKNMLDIFFKDITGFGGLSFYLFLMVFFLAFGNFNNLNYDLFLALIFAVSLTIFIRLIYFKDRPNKQSYSNLFERLDASSFPSLHSMRITIICVLLSVYIFNIYMFVLTFFMWVGVLASRIYLKKHDWKDVFAGVFFGFLISAGLVFFTLFF